MLAALNIDMNDSGTKGFQQIAAEAAEKRGRPLKAAEVLQVDSEEEEEEQEEEEKKFEPKTKKWMNQGLYVGQDREFDGRFSESKNRNKRKSKQIMRDSALPLPMFSWEKYLDDENFHRDFKLPFDVYHPLPKKVKVEGWVKLHKSK